MTLALETIRMRCIEEGCCLLWTEAINSAGYPCMTYQQRNYYVRRHVFTSLMGKTVKKGQVVSATCEQKRCVSPECLYARTRSAVSTAGWASGKRATVGSYHAAVQGAIKRGDNVLDFEKARFIRQQCDGMTHVAVAKRFKCSPSSVANIRQGRTWREIQPQASVFSWRP